MSLFSKKKYEEETKVALSDYIFDDSVDFYVDDFSNFVEESYLCYGHMIKGTIEKGDVLLFGKTSIGIVRTIQYNKKEVKKLGKDEAHLGIILKDMSNPSGVYEGVHAVRLLKK